LRTAEIIEQTWSKRVMSREAAASLVALLSTVSSGPLSAAGARFGACRNGSFAVRLDRKQQVVAVRLAFGAFREV